jgi:hypothetical protein
MKKVCTTGPGSARPVVSITTRSKSSIALALLGSQQLQGGAQVFADGAADAAIAHLDDLLAGVGHEDVVVDVLLAELVLDDGDLLAVASDSTRLSSVVLPEPRKPVRMVAGMRLMGEALGEIRPRQPRKL